MGTAISHYDCIALPCKEYETSLDSLYGEWYKIYKIQPIKTMWRTLFWKRILCSLSAMIKTRNW